MSTLANKTQEPSLPPLVKGSTTYKLKVPRKVEEKIRYLIRKFPSTEWSGVLFYSHTGKFEDGSLEIHCEDIYPMDLGTGTFTDFKMDESVVGYIAENFDLFGCDMALVHSHHALGAFLSGTDLQTIRSEGNDTNCFVSLVVDTKGTYVAALTRKIKEKKQVTTADMGSSYEFFGEGSINLADSQHKSSTVEVVDRETIEYFMLDVEIEHVDNPLAYLDSRFDEIQEKKNKTRVASIPARVPENSYRAWVPNGGVLRSREYEDTAGFGSGFDQDISFHDGNIGNVSVKEPALFSEDEMDMMLDVSKWEPDPTIIHKLVCQMITCSLIISNDIDLKQWITRWMDKKYKEIFGGNGAESYQFREYTEFIVEFMFNQYMFGEDTSLEPFDDVDLLQGKIANAMYKELYQYAPDGSNEYIESYKEVLTRYSYE